MALVLASLAYCEEPAPPPPPPPPDELAPSSLSLSAFMILSLAHGVLRLENLLTKGTNTRGGYNLDDESRVWDASRRVLCCVLDVA